MSSSILFSCTNNVATLTLNRPEKYNSFNREMALDLQQALDTCNTDAEVRAVYITGAGKAFSAGQDLAEVTDPNGPGMARILSEHYNPIIRRIRGCEKPVIAAVNGVAAGAGANIALACDIVVAAHSASFIQAFSKIGLIPDSSGTFFLPRLIGLQKATALMMLGEKVAATEAEWLGMIYKVYTDDQFAEESMKLATTLAAMPTKGLAYAKQALNLSLSQNLEQQLQTEDELQQLAGSTEDFKEGVDAFLEKRTAKFRGF
jgi:2-(1,2-epoxy-1,2-dihydrophenyl)acetyl-CoA isomerase